MILMKTYYIPAYICILYTLSINIWFHTTYLASYLTFKINLICSRHKITYNFWNFFFSQLLYVYDTDKLAKLAIAKSELKHIL